MIRLVFGFRYALTRCFFLLMGLRVSHWRKAVEEAWGRKAQDSALSAYLERNTPRDAAGNVIDTLEKLQSAPVLTKNRLLEISKQKKKRGGFHRHTSGSSGQPTDVWLSRSELGRMLGVRDYCYRHCGIRLGYREGRLWGRPESGWKPRFKSFLLNRKIFHPAAKDKHRETERLIRWRPQYLYGYSSILMICAKELEESRKEIPGLRCVIVTAETILPAQKEFLSAVFQCPVYEEYGASEFDIIAFECRHGHRHLVNPWLVVEPDMDGRVLITDVTRKNQPMIRYELGDIMRIESCECQTLGANKEINSLEGRTINQFALISPTERFHAVEFGHVVDHYQKREQDYFQFKIKQTGYCQFLLECNPEPINGSRALAYHIEHEIKYQLGCTIEVGTTKEPFSEENKFTYFVLDFIDKSADSQ